MANERLALGARGEAAARAYLRQRGYSIEATNYRCRWGEIDIVASQGEVLVFVEVRTRRGEAFGSPQESITPRKRERLVLAAQHYLQEHSAEPHWRIDLVAVEADGRGAVRRIQQVENAVTTDDLPSPEA